MSKCSNLIQNIPLCHSNDKGKASVPQDTEISDNPTPPQPVASPPPTPTLSDKSYLALVIDDSAAIRKQLEIELRTSGLRSEFAESGEEALEKILLKEYDLIFLDIMIIPAILIK